MTLTGLATGSGCFSTSLLLAIFLAAATIPLEKQLIQGIFDILQPDVFFSLSFLCYTLAVPLDVLLFGNLSHADLTLVDLGLVCSILFVGAFWFSYYLIRPQRSKSIFDSPPCNLRVRFDKWLPLAMVVVGLSSYLFYICFIGGSISHFFEMGRIAERKASFGKGWMQFGLYVLQAGWLLLFARGLIGARRCGSRRKQRRVIVTNCFLFVIFAGFFLVRGERREFFLLGMSIVIIYSVFFRIDQRVLLVGALFGGVFLHLFSQARVYASAPMQMSQYFAAHWQWNWLNFATGELGSQFRTITALIRDNGLGGFRYGMTYLEAFLILIPSFLLPERPVPLSAQFAKVYYPEAYGEGGGVAFSFLGESWLNFGYAGPILLGLIAGFAVGWILHWFRKNRMNVVLIVTYGLFLPIVFYAPRADFATVLKLGLMSIVLALWAPYLAYCFLKQLCRG